MRIQLVALIIILLPFTALSSVPEKPKPETFSVDFPNQEIRTIIRNIADVHELNVVIPDSLLGTTSIKLRDVTWEQAFRVLLQPLGWHHERDGDIILIKKSESKDKDAQPVTDDMLSHVTGLQSSMVKSMLRDKEYAEALATFYHNLYTSLIEKGFSKDDALKIVMSSSISTE
jgi:type II secretory pathway component HofQ